MPGEEGVQVLLCLVFRFQGSKIITANPVDKTRRKTHRFDEVLGSCVTVFTRSINGSVLDVLQN